MSKAKLEISWTKSEKELIEAAAAKSALRTATWAKAQLLLSAMQAVRGAEK
jgi:hypothetical protein